MLFSSKIFKNQFGMSLLEIMVVMAIIAAAIGITVPNIANRNNQMKAAVRRLTVLSKQLHSTARLQGASYRIVVDLKERKEDEQEFWVEKSNSAILLPKDKEILIEEKNRQKKLKEENAGERKNPSTEGFTPDDQMLNGKQKLPRGLRFKSIEIAGLDQEVETGLIFIHYHPQGLVEEAAIHLRYGEPNEKGLDWTIAIHPLTGRAEIITEFVSLKEIQKQ